MSFYLICSVPLCPAQAKVSLCSYLQIFALFLLPPATSPVSSLLTLFGLPWWLTGKESTCQFRRLGLKSLDQEDPLEKETATHSSILAGGNPTAFGIARVGHNLVTRQQQSCWAKVLPPLHNSIVSQPTQVPAAFELLFQFSPASF